MSCPGSRWKEAPAIAGAPTLLRAWLGEAGSLTARIQARCREFHVQVCHEGYARPLADEHRLVGVTASRRHAWVREVLLHADDGPVVFAHSLLAPEDLTGAWHMARAIGCRPLGAALFADPRIRRGPIQVARLDARHGLHRRAEMALGQLLPVLWARRSLFMRLGRPLLVNEVFLPGIERLG